MRKAVDPREPASPVRRSERVSAADQAHQQELSGIRALIEQLLHRIARIEVGPRDGVRA